MAAGKPLGNCAIFLTRGDPTPTGVSPAGEKTTRHLPDFRAGQLRGDGRPGGFVFPRADARRDAQRGSPGGPFRGRQCWHHGDQLACAARHRHRLRRVGSRSVHRVRGQQRGDRPLRPWHGLHAVSRLIRSRAAGDGDQAHPDRPTRGCAGPSVQARRHGPRKMGRHGDVSRAWDRLRRHSAGDHAGAVSPESRLDH